MKKSAYVFLCLVAGLLAASVHAQGFKDGKLYLNEDGSHYFKFTLAAQAWVRYADYNPGTTIFGYAKPNGVDIGIRRFRSQLMAQVTDRAFIYAQIGENNFNNISDRKLGLFVHDAMGEYAVFKNKLSVGAGLSAWSGLSRFSSPAIATIMGVDAPLYLQSTNDVTDQFLRKLSVHFKGKWNKLDYRLALSQPLAIQKSSAYNPAISANAGFSPKPPAMETNAYVMYQFKDQEANLTPYLPGTYLGKKSVFNIGAGIVYQPRAMWYADNDGRDTVLHDMTQANVDLFYDAPLGAKGAALSAYAAFTFLDFGRNYLRNNGAMNPANGDNNPNVLNGGGNAFPLVGTGNVLYAQVGYKISDHTIGQVGVMPYASIQHADYERLQKAMDFFDIGINWLFNGHASKLTTAYQNRPVYHADGTANGRKGAVLVQYQVSFN